MATNVIILTSGTSWTVPADWNNANNTIEVIGGGGGGSSSAAGSQGAGGGGAYTKLTNFTLTPSSSAFIQIGGGGAAGSAGTDTWLNKTCLLYTSPSPRDGLLSRMPSSA